MLKLRNIVLQTVGKSKIQKGWNEILKNLKRMRDYENEKKYEKNCEENYSKKISETDTQILLVEPVLSLAGYDIYDPKIVKRASRGKNTREFDIEIYKNGKLFLAIEVKSLGSSEFNIDKILEESSKSNVGKLTKQNSRWTNSSGDGVGQLRAYCVNWPSKVNNDTIPVLTNGEKWVLFDLSAFINKNNLEQGINRDMVVEAKSILDKDFFETIIERIKNT